MKLLKNDQFITQNEPSSSYHQNLSGLSEYNEQELDLLNGGDEILSVTSMGKTRLEEAVKRPRSSCGESSSNFQFHARRQ